MRSCDAAWSVLLLVGKCNTPCYLLDEPRMRSANAKVLIVCGYQRFLALVLNVATCQGPAQAKTSCSKGWRSRTSLTARCFVGCNALTNLPRTPIEVRAVHSKSWKRSSFIFGYHKLIFQSLSWQPPQSLNSIAARPRNGLCSRSVAVPSSEANMSEAVGLR